VSVKETKCNAPALTCNKHREANTHKYNEPRQSYIIFENHYNPLKHRFIRCIAFSFRQQAEDMLQEIHTNRFLKKGGKREQHISILEMELEELKT